MLKLSSGKKPMIFETESMNPLGIHFFYILLVLAVAKSRYENFDLAEKN